LMLRAAQPILYFVLINDISTKDESSHLHIVNRLGL
jgi:hypothetical protein